MNHHQQGTHTTNKKTKTGGLLILYQHPHQTRTIDGIATAKYIRAETDTADMEIQTSDGQKWLVTDYILPINTPVQMTFDTHGTADPADDTILQIIATTNF